MTALGDIVTGEAVPARPPFRGEPRGGTIDERLDRLTDIVDALRHEDAATERDRVLQYAAVDALREAGVLSLRAPTRYGGPGGSVRQVLTAVIQIARGSSNVPRRCELISGSRSAC